MTSPAIPDNECVSAWKRPLVSFPLLTALLVFIGGAMSAQALADADSYWHVAVGRWILQHHQFPTQDYFSHSMPGVAWTAHEWLSEIVLFEGYQYFGWAGLQIIASVCFAITAAYMLRFALQRMEPVHALPFVAICLSMVSTHFLVRPHVLVWPLTALWLGTLFAASESRRDPPWWLLVVLLLWTNLHASFVIAIGIAGLVAADATWQEPSLQTRLARAKRWLPFLCVSVLCVLVNPQGVGTFVHAFEIMRMKSTLAVIGEWQSADFHTFQFILLWIVGVMALAFTGRLRLSLFRIVFVLGFFYLALKHQRYHSLLGLVSPFVLAVPLAHAFRREGAPASDNADGLDALFRRLSQPAQWIGVAAIAAMGAAFTLVARDLIPYAPGAATTPVKALAAFEATGVKGNVFNGYGLGGFLIFKSVPVFVDGRADMYGDPFMDTLGDAVLLRVPQALEKVLTKYRIAWTMLGPKTAAVELLDHLPEWQRIYGDSVAVVHVRRDLLHAARPRLSPPAHQ